MVFSRKNIFSLFVFFTPLLMVRLAFGFPVTVDSCGKQVVFENPPSRVVIHDINMAEMAFALELQPSIIGVTGITGWYHPSDTFKKAQGNIPEIVPKQPNIENLIAVSPDFLFAGWYYGLEPGGEVTPDTLAPFGIKTLLLSESCIHLDKTVPAASMDLLYNDMLKLGKIFAKEKEAQNLVESWKARLARVEKNRKQPTRRVFLYDSGEEKPFTAGKYAIISAMIRAAGGKNILDDMENSWGRSSWEVVATRDPEFLILLDYQKANGVEQLWNFLNKHPAMRETAAVKNKNYITLRYSELTPGPSNIGAIEKMAEALRKQNFNQ